MPPLHWRDASDTKRRRRAKRLAAEPESFFPAEFGHWGGRIEGAGRSASRGRRALAHAIFENLTMPDDVLGPERHCAPRKVLRNTGAADWKLAILIPNASCPPEGVAGKEDPELENLGFWPQRRVSVM